MFSSEGEALIPGAAQTNHSNSGNQTQKCNTSPESTITAD
jgi:hypothetical protein